MASTVAPEDLVERLAGELHLSKADIARALDMAPGAWTLVRSGQEMPRPATRRRLVELAALLVRVRDTFDASEVAAAWLATASAYLGGIEPVEALRRGQIERVDAALEALDSGVFL